MQIIIALFVFLMILGLFILFDIRPHNLSGDFEDLKKLITNHLIKRQSKKKISIKKQVELKMTVKKDNFIVKNFIDAKKILDINRKTKNIKKVYIASAVGIGIAIIISIALRNIFIFLPLTVGLTLMPVWYVKIKESSYIKGINDELETGLSCITASYMRTDNIVLAVEENLKILNDPIRQSFMIFYKENKLLNSNVEYGIIKLKNSFNNTIFSEWCDAVIQCLSDRTLKATLYPIVQKFTDVKKVQAELDTSMMLPMQNFIIMTATLLLMIPVMASMQPGWFDILINTIGGKILLSLTVIVVILGINKAIDSSKPIEYKK